MAWSFLPPHRPSYASSYASTDDPLWATDTYSASSSASSLNPKTVSWRNLGPLRTEFKAPGACKEVPTSTLRVKFGSDNYYSCGADPNAYLSSSCVPNATAANELYFLNQNIYGNDLVASFYSPGLSCPAGWETAAQYTLRQDVTTSANLKVSPSWADHLLHTGGTHIVCCPSGLSIRTNSLHTDDNYNFYPIGCVSTVRDRTAGAYCSTKCGDLSYTANETFTTMSCIDRSVHMMDFVWYRQQTSMTVAYTAQPLYLIRQSTDHPPPSAATTIAPAVIVPIAFLAAFIAGIVWLLKRRKQRRKQSSTANLLEHAREDNDRRPNHIPIDTSAIEAAYELPRRITPHTSRTRVLQSTSRLEADLPAPSVSLRPEEAPPPSYESIAGHNRSSSSSTSAAGPDGAQGSESRLATLESESAQLDEDIRQRQMQDLIEQKRRIDEEIAALRSRER